MATYREVIADVLNTFKQVFDDASIQKSQALFWVNVVANRLRKQHGDKHDTGLYLTQFVDVQVLKDASLDNRKYVELPAKIFDLDMEKAVKYITYNFESLDCCSGPAFARVFFQRTTVDKSHRLYMSPYEKPDLDRPYFYRAGERIYFLGLECAAVKTVEMGLFTAFDTTLNCTLDDEIDLPDDLIQVLILEVRNLGRLSLMIPKDNVNEGQDETAEDIRRRGLTVPQQPSIQTDEQQ